MYYLTQAGKGVKISLRTKGERQTEEDNISSLLSVTFRSHLLSVGFRSTSNSSLEAFSASAPVFYSFFATPFTQPCLHSVNALSSKLLLNVFPSLIHSLSFTVSFCSSFSLSSLLLLSFIVPPCCMFTLWVSISILGWIPQPLTPLCLWFHTFFFITFVIPGIWLGVFWIFCGWTLLLGVYKTWSARPVATIGYRQQFDINIMCHNCENFHSGNCIWKYRCTIWKQWKSGVTICIQHLIFLLFP